MRKTAAAIALMLLSLPVSAGTLTGTVRNGTKGTLAGGLDVFLIQLQGGMETLADTKTDSQGRYSFDRAEIGASPMLIRVVYRGVNYHQNVPPGRAVADVEVYEPTARESDLRISRVMIVQPNGPVLIVGEEFSVENVSQPPAAFGKEFEFRVPPGAEVAQISAWGPSGMPTVQGKITKGKDHYAVAFPLRPGKNGVRVSYELPYPGNRAAIGTASFYGSDRVTLVAPPTLQIDGSGFAAAGTEQGWNLYARGALAANAAFTVNVSGTAPPPTESAEPAGQPAGDSGASGTRAARIPARLDSLKWVLVAGFGAVFFVGVMLMMRKSHWASSPAQVQVDSEVRQGLDGLKDLLFRLELRRQAGTITEEEYSRERSRAEKQLRDLVRG